MLFKKNSPLLICTLLFLFLGTACKTDPNVSKEKEETPVVTEKETVTPRFKRDSAYNFVAAQVAFGPRVPNTKAHKECKEWLAAKLDSYGAEVVLQDFEAKAYTGTILKATNIIGRINPDHPKRVVLSAHWDSRHIADADPDASNRDKAILGADDGASGVGVLLEIARLVKDNPIDMGIDIVLFDAEDHGDNRPGIDDPTSWCLGAQYWAKNLHAPGYRAEFGILLDMVGGKGARFAKEEVSMSYAPTIMDKIWKLAQNMGYGNYFVDTRTRGLTDDHLFVNKLSNVRMVDIINQPATTNTGFVSHWHTQNDNMSTINKNTLHAVGQTVLAVCYKHADGTF